MPEKLTAKDYRFIFICAALTAISLTIAVKYFYAAFPEASINIDVTQGESRLIAEQFLAARGAQVADDHHAAIFNYDSQAKVFLEKEMGLKRANELFSSRIKLWRWQHRWFRPLQKEEFRVAVTPSGEIVSFEHVIREEAPGARLSSQAARARAERFLTQVMKRDLARLEFVEARSTQRPHRADHTFIWKDRAFDFKGSSYRFAVIVQGDVVGGYQEYLQVPERWTRDYQHLRSLNHTAGTVDTAIMLLLFVGLLVMLIIRIRGRDIRWRTALNFGIIAAGLNFLAALNSLPTEQFYYQTTQSYGSFLMETILGSLLSAFGLGALIFLITAGAEPLYRQRFKDRISLSHLFDWRSMRTKRFFLSLILGLTLAPCFIAYQTVFYLLADKLGAWVPADVPYDDLLNTSIPWAAVLLSGFFPAVSEEFLFRMFSIPFLEKLLKSTAPALVLAGFIWGFGHAEYPNQPFYIRGVEVGLAGIVAGIILLRFNILALLVWHYTIDAAYTALLMLRSDDPSFILSGSLTAFIFLIPLLVALVSYLRTGRFESEGGLTNRTETTPPPATEEPTRVAPPAPPIAYQPLSTKRILLGFLVVGLLLSFSLLKVERFGDFVDFAVSRTQARRLADDFLRARRVDAGRYRSVITAQSHFNALAAKYILMHADVKTFNDLFGQQMTSAVWVVRYFRPGQKEEYRVSVDPRRKSIYTFEHIVAEDAPGARLTKDQALAVATAFLTAQGVNPEEYELIESDSEERPARRDYRLIWQAGKGDPRNIGDARFRLRIEIQGDEVSRFQRFLKLPEDWVRQRHTETPLTSVRSWGRILLWSLLGFFAITIFVKRAQHSLIRWRPTIWLALGAAGLYGLHLLNNLPLLYQDYNTSLSPNVHLVTKLTGDGMALVVIFIAATFVIGLGTSLYPEALGALRQPGRGQLARDAVLGSLMLIGGMFGIGRVRDLLAARFPAAVTVSGLALPGGIDTALPALSQLALAMLATGAIVVALGLMVHLARRYLRTPVLLALALIVILPLLVPPQAQTTGEFVFALALLSLNVGAALAFIRGILRQNLLAYPVSIFLLICAQDGYKLMSQSAMFFRVNGAMLLATVGVVIAWLLWSHRRFRRRRLDPFQQGRG